MNFDYEIIKKMFRCRDDEILTVIKKTENYILLCLNNYDKDVLNFKLSKEKYEDYIKTKNEYDLDKCLHKDNGPAIIWNNTEYIEYLEWWLDGIKMSFDEWCEKTPISNEEIFLIQLKYK